MKIVSVSARDRSSGGTVYHSLHYFANLMHKTILYSFPAFLCVRDMGKIHKITGVFPFFQFFGEYFDSEFIKQSKEIYIIRRYLALTFKIFNHLTRFSARKSSNMDVYSSDPS
jgi:hypothetical protein